jgi:capsular exopolysaccharide synthesis family protein
MRGGNGAGNTVDHYISPSYSKFDKNKSLLSSSQAESVRRLGESEGFLETAAILIDAIRKRKRFIALVAACIFCGVILLCMVVPPTYESTAKIVVDRPGSEAFAFNEVSQGEGEPDDIETQVHVLRSDGLALEVARMLRLEQNRGVIKENRVEKLIDKLQFVFLHWPWQHNESDLTPVRDSATISVAEQHAVEYLHKHTTIVPMKNSRVIAVKVRGDNKYLCTEIANGIVQKFLSDISSSRNAAVALSCDLLSGQLKAIRERGQKSQLALSSYSKTYGIVEVDDENNSLSQKESELIHYHALAEADKLQLEATLSAIRDNERADAIVFGNNFNVQQLIGKISDVSGQLTQARVYYDDNHPNIIKLHNQLDELRMELGQLKKQIIGEMQLAYIAAASRERALGSQIDQEEALLTHVSAYNSLRRQAQADEDLYHLLYARMQGAVLSSASRSSTIRRMDQAVVPFRPIWPNPVLMFPLGFVAACFGGIAAGIVKHSMDSTVRSAQDLSAAMKQTSVLPLPITCGVEQVPIAKKSHGVQQSQPRKEWYEIQPFILQEPSSHAAESIRSLMGVIVLNYYQCRSKVFVISSPSSGEGKTTVSLNLAAALAERGPTCFVDADLRKRNRTEMKGIYAHYRNEATAEEIQIRQDGGLNLTCIGAGSGTDNPIAILMSEKFQRLVYKLRCRYDFVVIDSPPILPYADCRLLTLQADGVVLVGYEGRSSKRSIRLAAGILNRLSVPVVGVVLNGARVNGAFRGAYYE